MLIDVKEATVKTARVEIKTLVVSGKQVTLALFRQLQEEYCLDETGQIKGVPWGRVNYHWADCKGEWRDHLHVVWQKDEELRRTLVSQPSRTTRFEMPEGQRWLVSATLEGWKPSTFPAYGDRWIDVNFGDFGTLRIELDDQARDLRRIWSSGNGQAYDDSEARERLQTEDSEAEMRALIVSYLEKEANYVSNESASWQVLRELPHLFIAV